MQYPDGPPPHMPPGPPWVEHTVDPTAPSNINIYYSSERTRVPVRRVNEAANPKSDPNIETFSYGLCSTCTRDVRERIVDEGRPEIFFVTNVDGRRQLVGYYSIGWYSRGPVLPSFYRRGKIQADFRLVADRVELTYPTVDLQSFAREYALEDELLTGFRKKTVPGDVADLLRSAVDSGPDAYEKYVNAARRLEQYNQQHYGTTYPNWGRTGSFTMETIEEYVHPPETIDVERFPWDDYEYENKERWECYQCSYEFTNGAPLKLCPECQAAAVVPHQSVD